MHLTRYAMYAALKGVVVERPRRVLSVSGSERLCDVLGWTDGVRVLGDRSNLTILELPFRDSSFDGVVADQVLEHVEGDPQRAFAECARVLAPGGTMVQTTCFMNPRHDLQDFWRFTPDALELLARTSGLDVVAVGAWGNFASVAACRFGLRYLPIPDNPRHPLNRLATRNDPDWPVSTWVVGRKRSDRPSAISGR